MVGVSSNPKPQRICFARIDLVIKSFKEIGKYWNLDYTWEILIKIYNCKQEIFKFCQKMLWSLTFKVNMETFDNYIISNQRKKTLQGVNLLKSVRAECMRYPEA